MTRYMLRRLAQVAALRARGTDWIEVAKAVNSRPVVCRRWPDKYPAEWRALYDEARRMRWEEINATARQALAELLQSADPRIRKQAQKLVERYGDRLRG